LIDKSLKFDNFDMKILNAMQSDASLSQRDLAEKVGMSQNACWRRLQRLNLLGLISGSHNVIDLNALGLDLTVFVMIRTSRHSREWSEAFRLHVERLPEVVDFYRIGGEWDYLIKVVTNGMGGYDRFYQKLITDFELATVTGFFSMEAIINNRPVDLLSLR
jgi:Lrp/AsnC family transcriptional regulator